MKKEQTKNLKVGDSITIKNRYKRVKESVEITEIHTVTTKDKTETYFTCKGDLNYIFCNIKNRDILSIN